MAVDYIRASETQKHLFSMPSIRKMPLIISAEFLVGFPFDDRYDVYYDIYVLLRDGVARRFAALPEKVASQVVEHFLLTTDELQEALIHNRRHVKKNKQLGMF